MKELSPNRAFIRDLREGRQLDFSGGADMDRTRNLGARLRRTPKRSAAIHQLLGKTAGRTAQTIFEVWCKE